MLSKLAGIFSAIILSLVVFVAPVSAEYVEGEELDSSTYEYTTTSYDEEQMLLDQEKALDDLQNSLNDIENRSELTQEEAEALAAGILAMSGAVIFFSLIISIPFYIYGAWSQMVISNKLNVPNSWMAWIPFLNLYNFAKCAGMSGWTLLLMFIPFVGIIYVIIAYMNIAERRGFEKLLGLLVLVPIAQIVLPGYLAWAEPKKAETVASN